MSEFTYNDMTNAGRVIAAKALLGENVEFTKIVMGDGYLPPGTVIRDMTEVVNPVVDIAISKMVRNPDETIIIGGKFSNADIQTEFFYRELALFAKASDGVEVLYCYGNAEEYAERITPAGDSTVIEKTIDIVTAISTTANVTANIVRTTDAHEIAYDDSATKLGAEDVQAAIEILNDTIIISHDPPSGTGWKLWLQIDGEIPDYPDYPVEPPVPESITVELDTAPLDAPGDFAAYYDDGTGETLQNFTDDPDDAGDEEVIIVEDE